eukprot:jgi/Bigna1/70484/fgenesh1_pg.12_\
MESYGQPVILLLHLLAAYAPRKALAFKTQDKHARLYANASTNANATMAHTGRQLRDEIHMNSSVSSSLQYPHFHRGVMNSLKSAASSVASVAAPSLKKAEKLLKCVDKCNGRGTCEIDFSRVTKDGVNNPFYCKCQEISTPDLLLLSPSFAKYGKGYIGISCATKVDQYLKWFMTKGKTEFPRCCNICNEQEQAPAHYEYMPRQMNPFNPEHCNVLYQSNVARNSAPSWCNRFSSFVEEEVAMSGIGGSLSSSKKKADDGSCCVICSPNYIQAQRRIDVQLQADVNGLRPPQAKGPTWFWEWGEPGLGGGGQPNLIPTKDGSENTCCSVCPRRVEGPFYTRSDNDMTSEERRNILDTGAETAQKRGFYEGNGIFYKDSGCCETCPSQFW